MIKNRRMCVAAVAVAAGFILVFSVNTVLAANNGSNKSYMIISKTNMLPSGLAGKVGALNGKIQAATPEIGIATAVSDDPNFAFAAAKIPGIRAVVPDVIVPWIDPNAQASGIADGDYGNPPSSGDDDFLFDLQWGHDAVNVPEAWNLGAKGNGVKVFVLDSGIDSDNPDLAPNLNKSLCVSFVPGENWDVRPGFYFNHGTHVAGIIAAADNAYGIIGVAPEAQLVSVKVLSEYSGSGALSWVNAGIVYAANMGADIINMSLSGHFPRHGYLYNNGTPDDPSDDVWISASTISEWCVAQQRAVNYAYQKGATIVASAGNDRVDIDHTADYVYVPAQLAHVICVSATAPYGWAYAFTADLDRPASYTNFGQSIIDFAAPGGDGAFYYDPNAFVLRTVGVVLNYCYVFDYVFSTSSEGWWWAAGTSMAAPYVSGIAALVIGASDGSLSPAQVEAVLRASADDLGKPGRDDYYGKGRVNALKAVMNLKK